MHTLDSIAQKYHQPNVTPIERRWLQAQMAIALRPIVQRLAACGGLSTDAVEDGVLAGLCALEEYDPLTDTFEDLATVMAADALKGWTGVQ